jgi:hypothetical protein
VTEPACELTGNGRGAINEACLRLRPSARTATPCSTTPDGRPW